MMSARLTTAVLINILPHGASVLSRSVNETAVLFVPDHLLKAAPTVHM
jgi:hypothetical protein